MCVLRERESERERERWKVCAVRGKECFEIKRVCVAIERGSVRGERKRGRDSVCRMIEMCLR